MLDTLQKIMQLHGDSPAPLAVADRRLNVVWGNAAALARYPHLAQPDGLWLMLPGGGAAALSARLSQEQKPLSLPLPLLDLALALTPVDELVLVQPIPLELGGTSLHPQGTERLLSAVTGQLRAPLSNIFASVSSVSQLAELAENERLEELSAQINHSSYQLLRFTSELTGYLRDLAGLTAADRALLDLRDLLAQLGDAASVLTRSVGIALTTYLPDGPVLIPGEAQALQTALLHLISNACRFTREGNRIEITLTAGEQTAVVTVADRGLGIPPELTGRVFEAFFSHDPEGRPFAGAGLGLTLVRTIVARHGGTVALRSTEGEGTSVALSLPLAGSDQLELRSPPRVADLLRDRFSPLHVLLCDSCGAPRA